MEQSYRPDKDVRDAVVVWSGTTTSPGLNTTIVDSGLTQADNYWINIAVLIKSGNSNGQIRRISAFTQLSGTITVDTAFASVIASGTKYDILGQHVIPAGTGDATLANQLLILGDVGVASTSTLGSLYDILGNPAQDFNTMVGYEGTLSLAAKLTAARAGYLNNINQAGLLQVTAARAGYIDNINQAGLLQVTATRAGYLDDINNTQLLNVPDLSTLTAARIGYLDNINNVNLGTLPVISAARIGYLDNINQAGLLQVTAARVGYLDDINNVQLLNVPDLSTLTAARIGYLDNINNVNLSTIANISTLNATNIGYLANINQAGLLQVTAARAGYLDNINNVNLGTLPAITAARIGYLDNINNTNLSTIANISTLNATNIGYLANINQAGLLQVTAARAGYLDNINQAGLLQVTAARAGYLDNIAANAAGRQQTITTTIELNQGAATYDLFTGNTQNVIVDTLIIRTPNSAAGGSLTSISIQTNDATPQVFISSVTGAVANLTAQAQLSSDSPIMVATGQKIQLTIAGGATGAGYVCTVAVMYKAITAGGYLS